MIHNADSHSAETWSERSDRANKAVEGKSIEGQTVWVVEKSLLDVVGSVGRSSRLFCIRGRNECETFMADRETGDPS